MKILHICTDFWPSTGGIEKFVLDLARHGQQLGLDAQVLCFNRTHGSAEILPPHDRVGQIDIRRVPFLDLKYYKPTLLPVALLKQADVIHVHGIGAPLDFVAAAKWRHRRPIVLSTHGGIFHTGKLSAVKRFYFRGVHRVVQKLVDCTVACSRQDYDLFHPVARRLVLIENGVELGALRGYRLDEKDHNRLVFVGRLSRNKGVENLVRAFHGLSRMRPAARLRIVGPDWQGLAASVHELIAQLGLSEQVTLSGEVSDAEVIEELGRAAFFVSASQYEGFGLSVIEAMAAGCIPLLNDIPAFRNLIQDGQNGYLLNFADQEQAACRLEQAMAANGVELAGAARARAEEFAWERQAPKWKQLYEQMASARLAPAAVDAIESDCR